MTFGLGWSANESGVLLGPSCGPSTPDPPETPRILRTSSNQLRDRPPRPHPENWASRRGLTVPAP
eukprot:3732219-Pyramimonas_sp.AAC.1